jgi:hypothetical protein
LDEVVFSEEEITPEMLAKISHEVSQHSYFWVASRSDIPPYKENDHLKGKKKYIRNFNFQLKLFSTRVKGNKFKIFPEPLYFVTCQLVKTKDISILKYHIKF